MQAKRAGPKLEAGPKASAERSEGTMEARQGRDAAGGSMRHAHDSATGRASWPGTPRPELAFGYLSTCSMADSGVPTELAWSNTLPGIVTIKDRP